MSRTGIEWTDATWNPIRGCSRVSAGCVHCYAEKQAARFAGPGRPFDGFVRIQAGIGPQWTGKVELIESKLAEPLRWREPKRIFVNSMSDLFHEGLSDSDIFKVFIVMGASQRHTFQILTKRPARMLKWISQVKGEGFPGWPLPNVWLGVSCEDQETADDRIPLLLQTPAAVRFASYEPALGPIDFSLIKMDMAEVTHDLIAWHQKRGDVVTRESYENYPQVLPINSLTGYSPARAFPALDWIICGGESGPGARPFDIEWARNTIAQCKAAGLACFVKQLGADPFEMVPHIDYDFEPQDIRLKDRKGGNWDEWPADLRVREFPQLSTNNSPARL